MWQMFGNKLPFINQINQLESASPIFENFGAIHTKDLQSTLFSLGLVALGKYTAFATLF